MSKFKVGDKVVDKDINCVGTVCRVSNGIVTAWFRDEDDTVMYGGDDFHNINDIRKLTKLELALK